MEHGGRRAKRQGRSWPVVQPAGDPVQVNLGESIQRCPLREVLSEKTIGVFVRSSLPGALRVAEVHLDVRGDAESTMLGHLGPAIQGQRPAQFRRKLAALARYSL